jgi:hypothetical protein
MLEHLIDFEPEVVAHSGKPTPLEREHPADTIDAKVKTADWLKSLGAADTDTVVSQAEVQAARASFTNLVSSAPAEITHEHLAQIKTPAAVQHLVGMLTAYDWEFVQQAKELRGYTVAKLLEECENPSANIRLKALGLLGKVTEVGLFTDKIEVKKLDLTDEEIDRKLKDKLAKFMGVQDADVIEDIKEVSTHQQDTDETERPDTESN